VSELKKWAKEHMRGVENVTIPSFSPDLSELDEEGIRWDVRQAVAHGFFSTLCAAEVGLTFEEAKRFVEIVTSEAKGKICVSTTLLFDTIEQNIEFAKHAQRVGCNTALLGYPAGFAPASAEEVYRVTKEICDAAPDLGIVVYATHQVNFERLDLMGFPMEILDRLADIGNVVAMKIGSNDFAFIYECFARCGDKILVNAPMPDMAAITVAKYGQQWLGAAVYEMWQSPEKPYLVDYFNLLLEGKPDKAIEIYRRISPLTGSLYGANLMSIMYGAYPWSVFKYYQWCVGGNGGLVRQPFPKPFMPGPDFMMMTKAAYRSVGIEPREPDEEFFVGRVNYAKRQKKGE
jgi:4-hydroxy-tetrahydrodipicolinate synthase